MKKYIELTCDGCGKAFSRYRKLHFKKGRPAPKHAYCSRACRRTRKPIPCSHCGKTVIREPNQINRAENVYCSPQCHDEARKTRETRECIVCGAEYESHQCRENNRYCSAACYDQDKTNVLTGRTFSEETRRKMSLAKRGRRHPNWMGGTIRYYGRKWASIAAKARERDGHMCVRCGLIQETPALHVHHIIPLREFGGDFDAAHDLDNLVTLCHPCHAKAETTYRDIRKGRH